MDNAFAEKIVLRNDNGKELAFTGRMFSESSYYDEQTSTLTRMRLYATDDGRHVYSIVSGAGAEKSRRNYIVRPGRDMCEISDGTNPSMVLPTELLFSAVFGLCGIDSDRAEELRPALKETLRLISGV